MANDKLKAVVQCTARIQLVTEGGWQYSSPLVRESGGSEVPLLDTPDAISIVALMVGDIDQLSRELFALVEEAKSLGIDPMAMCSLDLPCLARTYQQLAMDLATASQRAIENMQGSQLANSATRQSRRRGPKANGAGSSTTPATNQTSLLDAEFPDGGS